MDRGANAETLMTLAGRLILGAVFAYAGAAKALNPAAFAVAIDAYRLLPHPMVAALALYLPWIEISCAVGLFTPRVRTGALSLLFVLCVVFAVAIASAWIRDLDISCGCFGAGETGAASLRRSLLRSVTLAFLSAVLLWREQALRARGGANIPPQEGVS
jgi:putative oxidoreductase